MVVQSPFWLCFCLRSCNNYCYRKKIVTKFLKSLDEIYPIKNLTKVRYCRNKKNKRAM